MLNNKQLLSATCYNNIIAMEEINAKLKIVFPNNSNQSHVFTIRKDTESSQ